MNWKMLSTALALLAGLSLCQAGLAAGGSTTTSQSASSDPLSFAVSLPLAAFNVGDPIPLTLALSNVSSVPQTVNKRLAINDAEAPAPFGEVTVDITLPSGDHAAFFLDLNLGAPGQADFATLAAGQSVTTAAGPADMAALFGLSQPGSYTLTATYTNTVVGPATVDDAGDAVVIKDIGAWQGQLQSNTVSFQIN